MVLEEFLEGEELSLLALCDGENVVPLAPAQDYKRIFDGDEGPNTGGMGSYSPVPGFDAAEVDELVDAVHRPVVATMARRGTPFHGVLYAGLMMTADGSQGARVQHPLRRPRDAGGAAAAALATCVDLCLAAREPGGLAGADGRVRRRLGGDRGARLGRLPGVLLEGRRDHRPRAAAASRASR